MKIIRVKLSSIIDLFCFIGCSIQIYHVTCIYLKFKVRHEVTYDYADQVELPTIDIIIPMAMTINLTELFIRYPQQMTRLCKRLFLDDVSYTNENFSVCSIAAKKVAFLASVDLASFIKVKDIKELTIDPREQIVTIGSLNSGEITDECTMKRYYSGIAIFLRIVCTKQDSLITTNTNIISSYEGNIAAIYHSFGPYFGIRFTSQLDMPEYELSKYFMVTQKSPQHVAVAWVRYEKMVSHSLPYPYETNCRYYDRLKALSNCVLNYTLHSGGLMRFIINEWHSQPQHLGFVSLFNHEYEYEYEEEGDEDNNDDEKVDDEKLKIGVENCVQQSIASDCEKTSYLIVGRISSEQVPDPRGLIVIEQPVTPIMYFNANPELQLSEYLIFVGSIIATWFGYSIFDRLMSPLTWIAGKFIANIRKNRESKRPIKIFIVRNPYYFTKPIDSA
uniref:Uncharacterized protein n=1 Tax=Tetranychus urticae TaxID=32264 RepID=T1JUF7_TETUR